MRQVVRTGIASAAAVAVITALTLGAAIAPADAAVAAKKPAVLTAVLKRPAGHPAAGQKVTITFRGTHAGKTGHIVKYTFNAGDKTKVTSGKKVPATLAHVWKKAGTYKISLTVTDSNHKTVTVKQNLVLLAPHLAVGGATAGSSGGTDVDAPVVCQAPDAADTTPGSPNGTQLSGTVTDASGNPLSGIPVTLGQVQGFDVPFNTLLAGIPLLDTFNVPGNLSIPNISNTVRTDAQGHYSLDALPLDWVPDFTLPGFPTLFLGKGSVLAGPLRDAILRLLINPSVSANTAAGANPNYTEVSADRAGHGLTGLTLPTVKNFTLAPAGNISGHLLSASGAPVAGQPVEFTEGSAVFAVTSAADGSFSMPSVPLGLISLHEVSGFTGPVAPQTQLTIDSCVHDVTGIVVTAV
jgi:PKD repeat protein